MQIKLRHFQSAILWLALIGLCPSAGNGLEGQAASVRTSQERNEYRSQMESADQKIADEVKTNSELMKNLEYLTTEIGPRLTGSVQMKEASKWVLERFRHYGLETHLETVEIPHAWIRGEETAGTISPISRRIPIHSMGWGKATPGSITARVVVLEDAAQDGKEKLDGSIVLLGKPARLPSPLVTPENAYDAVIPPPQGVPEAGQDDFYQRSRLTAELEGASPAVVLEDSGKIDNLFTMRSDGLYTPSNYPEAYLAHEDYCLLYRLAKAKPVTMRVNLSESFSSGPVEDSIVVAEIKGSQIPDERVILGAHLDSWDLGQGALDNGTGSMAVLEAARTLKALGWKPKRTVTFILFTGEEQGGLGAETFLNNHIREIPKIDAVLIHDTGTGKVSSIALERLWDTVSLMEEIYRPLQEVFDLKSLSTRYFGASDHVPFLYRGVPAYFCIQEPDHYREVHHSQTDTFDKVIPEEINEGAALLAAWAWNVSEMPQRLPRNNH